MSDTAAIDPLIASIDQLLATGEGPDLVEGILARMEEVARRTGGLAALAAHYGGREEPALLRPLTFLVARTTSQQGASADAGLSLSLLGQLRCTDDTARSNLATALHLLAMHRAIPADAPAERLGAFLAGCLEGGPALRDAGLPALASLLAAGVRFPDSERRALISLVEGLRGEDPEWAERALARLREPG